MRRGNEVAAAVPRDAELGSGRRGKKKRKGDGEKELSTDTGWDSSNTAR